MISVVITEHGDAGSVSKAEASEIDALLARDDIGVWVDVTAPTAKDFQFIAEHFRFHPLTLEDIQTAHHHPKLDEYPGYLFLIIHGAQSEAGPKEYKPIQMALFLGKNYLVSFHPLEVDEIRRQLPLVGSLLSHGPARMMHYLLDRIVDEFAPYMERLEGQVMNVEEEVFETKSVNLLEDVFRLKRSLVHVRQTALHQRELLQRLTHKKYATIHEDEQFLFRDVYDHVVRLIDQVDSLREVVASVIEANVSFTSHRMNEVMRFLTILSTIFLPLTFIAGVYGMNFNTASPWNMPELSWPFGYVIIMATMLFVAAGMIYFFYRRRWF